MTDNEFTLFDRCEKIRSTIEKYGEENFYISFSGGKDSCVLSCLVDEAVPGNKIPRVYANTGIEYKMMVEFVKHLQEQDDRIVIIKPSVPIKPMLERDGYPFKSKLHSQFLGSYQANGNMPPYLRRYIGAEKVLGKKVRNEFICPKKLRFQFSPGYPLKVSDKCCVRMKEEPLDLYAADNGKNWCLIGITNAEGGRRDNVKSCISFHKKRGLNFFYPLLPVSPEWEEWYIAERNIEVCPLYYPPYNFDRTGCKGCPFNPRLQEDLDTLQKYFPAERKQCEIIWKPVYDEYRRLNYRLKPLPEAVQIDLFEEMAKRK